jgi:muramoyltetrapeptide carboxypeptidase
MLQLQKLRPGDKVRFVSPASTPDRDAVQRSAETLKRWGLEVEYGEHAFAKDGPFAGSDQQRAADLNAALRDPSVRAVFATRGGRGCYRIADQVDFEAVRRDPKLLIGFSENTILHLALWKECGLPGIHGAVRSEDGEGVHQRANDILRSVLMEAGRLEIASEEDEATRILTTGGTAAGPLIGGNLEMIATAAGWALPDLAGAILLLEGINMRLGQTDRLLTMLRKAGHLDGVAGVAIGQFTDCASGTIALLRDQLNALGVPLLGGLPLGHGATPLIVPVGPDVRLDADRGVLVMDY